MVEPVSMLGPGNGINWGWESTAAAADDDDDDDDDVKWRLSVLCSDVSAVIFMAGLITPWQPHQRPINHSTSSSHINDQSTTQLTAATSTTNQPLH